MPDIEQRIRDAYGPAEVERDALDRGWESLQLGSTPTMTPRPRRIRSPRLLVAVAAAIVSLSSAAWAAQQESVRELIGIDTTRPAERMRVFEDAPDGARGVSPQLREMLELKHPNHPAFDPDELREVIRYEHDLVEVVVHSAPAEQGQVCIVSELRKPRGGSGGISCGGGTRFNGHVTVGTSRDIRMGTVVIGIADDDVEQVRVHLSNGRTVDARMGRNAYLLHVPDPAVRTRGLEVALRDGTTLDVAMNGCLRAQLVPPPKSRLGCGYGMNQGPDPADLP